MMADNAIISNRVVVFYFMYIVHEGRAMISNQGHRGAPVFRHSSLRNKSVGSQEESTHTGLIHVTPQADGGTVRLSHLGMKSFQATGGACLVF